VQKTQLLLAFLFGLALALSSAAGLHRLGLDRGLLAGRTVENARDDIALAASGFSIEWSAITSGGGEIRGGAYSAQTSIGQPLASQISGGGYTLDTGYWPGVPAIWKMFVPLVRR